ncbi:MAG: formylglycine-generating enzyme family protein [Alphaproteobacteria bacterium]|nr:formylglycine-generating enzyme family protein [Alphaproteobacteria bacterium]MCW5744233.1 formylglycine-generating enzyme family protein [Alphaproteobacteria bacterium]
MRSWWLAFALSAIMGPAWAQQSFRDCPTCPEMVVIPPGSFTMGVAAAEEEREGVPAYFRGRSAPQHRVTIGYAFSLGRHEVTRGQFAAFAQATGRDTGTSCWTLRADGNYVETAGRDWRDPGFAQTENDPVVCVSWEDAQAYVEWLKRTTGKGYRLPSEAEWEYAVRAGSQSARYWGDSLDGTCLQANVADLTLASRFNAEKNPERFFLCTDGHLHTAPVGSFRPNAFGLHDALGNAWEWTGDCSHDTYNGAPANGDYWHASGDCPFRVARGGSWFNNPWSVRAGYRFWFTPGYRSYEVGFRVARTN